MGFLTVAPLRGCGHKQAYASQLGVVLTVASSGAVDTSKLMALRLVSFLQLRPPGLLLIPSSGFPLGLGFYQLRLCETVDNVLFFENC